MRVLVGCEFSQVVTKAFRDRGHHAFSCDLLPTDGNPEFHYQKDIFEVIAMGGWDLAIFHPPCTYPASSGLHWNKRIAGREMQTNDSVLFVKSLYESNIPKICIENPIGRLSTAFMKPTQIIQPWMFGEDASKSTCLWLKGLNKLQPTNIIKKDRYANQTPSGQNKLGPSADRWKLRSVTYQGIADAMAIQWG